MSMNAADARNSNPTMACKGCRRGEPFDGAWRPADQCWLCWLGDNDSSYRAAFGLPPFPGGVVKERAPGHVIEAAQAQAEIRREYPSLTQQAANLAFARAEWEAAGRPVRSDEECQRIHQEHCEPCEWFDSVRDRCRKCGCGLSKKASTRWVGLVLDVPDAIRMGNHHCPIGKW